MKAAGGLLGAGGTARQPFGSIRAFVWLASEYLNTYCVQHRQATNARKQRHSWPVAGEAARADGTYPIQQQQQQQQQQHWLDSPPASPHVQQQRQPWSTFEAGSGSNVPSSTGQVSSRASMDHSLCGGGSGGVVHAVVGGLRPNAPGSAAAPSAAQKRLRQMSLRTPTQAYSEVPSHHGRVFVLYIENNAIDQAVLHMLLGSNTESQYKLVIASSGAEALDTILSSAWLPDIVLMSSHLPDMTASEVCCQLRTMFSAAELPIVLLSSRSGEADMLQALEDGKVNDYVMKPLRRLELLARINSQVMIKQSVRREAESRSHYELLVQVLPPHIIQRLAAGQAYLPERHDEVTILFSDIVHFTELCSLWPTQDVVAMLDLLFSSFDDLCDRHGVFKVETIGDAYMVVAGHDGNRDHTFRMAGMAVDMLAAAEETQQQLMRMGKDGSLVQIRIGMHTGPAHSGVVGKRRPRYCFFGDTVNTASRMESSGFPMTVHISNACKSSMTQAASAHTIPGSDRLTRTSSSCSNASTEDGSSSSSSGGCLDADTPSQVGSRGGVVGGNSEGAVGDAVSVFPVNSTSSVILPWDLVDLGVSHVKGKGHMHTHLLQVGQWQKAVATTQLRQLQRHLGTGTSFDSTCSTCSTCSPHSIMQGDTYWPMHAVKPFRQQHPGALPHSCGASSLIARGESVPTTPVLQRQEGVDTSQSSAVVTKARRHSAVSFTGVFS